MALKPRKRKPAPIQPVEPKESASSAEETAADTSWMSVGSTSVESARAKSKSNSKPKVREFFFVKDEINATTDPNTGKKKQKGTATALVHFAVNYADDKYNCAIPRITVKEGGRFMSYTSPGTDCAIAQATGNHASIRPVYTLVDHRSYEHDGKEYTDMIKTWIPPATMIDLMRVAIENLCDSTGIDLEDIDITEYPAKISKSGSGRQTVWSLSFIAREDQYSDEAWDRVCGFFYGYEEAKDKEYDEITYEANSSKIAKLLAPDPRYILSTGGKYHVAGAPDEDEKEDVPY